MQVVLARTWKDEFERVAAITTMKRDDELDKEKLARRKVREQEKQDEERLDDKKDKEEWAALEEALAPPQDIAAYRVELERDGTATVEALMDNQEAADAVRLRIEKMLDEATVLPDGRRVFKTKDGQHVFDEHGQELTREEMDAATISDKKPKWETFKAETEEGIRLEQEKTKLVDYQAKLDAASDRLDKGELTASELKGMKAELKADMPDAVREKLGLEKQASNLSTQKAAAADVSQDAPTATVPRDMGNLMRQTGFAPMPSA